MLFAYCQMPLVKWRGCPVMGRIVECYSITLFKMEENLFWKLVLNFGDEILLGGEVIAIPGLPLLYSDPDMCPWMLVVVYYLVCILFTGILSYWMCWAGLLQVGCGWEPSVAAQIFGPSLERGVGRSSESWVRVWWVEPEWLRSSESLHLVLDLRVVFLGSSELFLARAGWFVLRSCEELVARACFWLQTWGFELLARASILSLERTFEFFSLARVSWLVREFLCLVARAT